MYILRFLSFVDQEICNAICMPMKGARFIAVGTALAPLLHSETRTVNGMANALRDLYRKGFQSGKHHYKLKEEDTKQPINEKLEVGVEAFHSLGTKENKKENNEYGL